MIKVAMLLISNAINTHSYWRNSSNSSNSMDTVQSIQPKLVMQIHDELIYELPVCIPCDSSYAHDTNTNILRDDKMMIAKLPVVELFTNIVRDCMEIQIAQLFGIKVPLIVNMHIGLHNWGDMQSI